MAVEEHRVRELVEAQLGERVPDEVWRPAWARFRRTTRAIWELDVQVRDLADDLRDRLQDALGGLPRPAGSRRQPPLRADRRREFLARLLAAEAAAWPEVREYRHDVLRGRLLEPDQVPAWLEARSRESGPDTVAVVVELPPGVADELMSGDLAGTLLRWRRDGLPALPPAPVSLRVERASLDYLVPGDRWIHSVPVGTQGPLPRLKALAAELTKYYGWREPHAVSFVLTGTPPPVTMASLGGRFVPAAPALDRLIMTVDPRLGPREVASLFAWARRRVLGDVARDRPLSEKHGELAVFIAGRLGERRTWAELVEEWNRQHPRWGYYQVGAEVRFARDARTAWERLTGRTWPDRRRGRKTTGEGPGFAMGRWARFISVDQEEGDDGGATGTGRGHHLPAERPVGGGGHLRVR